MLPLKDRFLTGLYVCHEGKALLIDCGEGMQVALAKAEIRLSTIELVLITHAHADHVTGLPGLLLSMGNCSRDRGLDIFYPESCDKVIRSLLTVCGRLPFEVRLKALPDRESTTFDYSPIGEMFTIKTLPLRHSVRCLGYSMQLDKKPVFQPENAKALGVPVEKWRLLHSGQSVTLEDGRIIKPSQVTGAKRDPIKITYVTDTLPFDEIADFAKGSQLFVCEGMYGEEDKKQSMDQKGHMLMQDACELAKKAQAQRLWLTHYSPAQKHPQQFEKQLRRIFDPVVISEDGAKMTL